MTGGDTGPLLRLEGIHKAFGATRALRGVSLAVRPGEVHALIGENGAGKSTLMKVLSGALRADGGHVELRGARQAIPSPAAGRRLGIAMIYQELTLAPHLTIEENLTLGLERRTLGVVRSRRPRIREVLGLLQHPDLPLDVPVRSLGMGLQQLVEIGRALMSDASVIIMDEPTSSLSGADTEALFTAIARLKASGIAVIYISHFLEEVMRVADTYTVLRDGESVATGHIADTTIPAIIEAMVGRKLTEMFPDMPHDIGVPLLEVRDLAGSPLPRGVSFTLRRGEILGIAGLVGAGRTETVRALFGLDRATGGTLGAPGGARRPARRQRPRRALRQGLDLLSENRKDEGLATSMTIAENTTLASLPRFAWAGGWGPLRLARERAAVRRWVSDLSIKCAGIAQPVSSLSGGNQQKVALARVLENGGEVVLLDEPTRGVDVGSKVDIYRLVGRLAAEGKAVVFVSSYLPELLGVCDTIAVMHRGRLSAARPARDWTEQAIMRVAVSGEESESANP